MEKIKEFINFCDDAHAKSNFLTYHQECPALNSYQLSMLSLFPFEEDERLISSFVYGKFRKVVPNCGTTSALLLYCAWKLSYNEKCVIVYLSDEVEFTSAKFHELDKTILGGRSFGSARGKYTYAYANGSVLYFRTKDQFPITSNGTVINYGIVDNVHGDIKIVEHMNAENYIIFQPSKE